MIFDENGNYTDENGNMWHDLLYRPCKAPYIKTELGGWRLSDCQTEILHKLNIDNEFTLNDMSNGIFE